MLIVPTAGWLLVVELCNLAMYAFSRVILGAYGSPASVGRFEGPVRAHNLLYALGGALAVPVVPTASRYVATGDERRLRELALRGTRYTLALFVPVCVTLIVLRRADPRAVAGRALTAREMRRLAILVSYWLLYGGLVVTPGFLVGAGRARQLASIMIVVAGHQPRLSLVRHARAGLEGPAIAIALPFFLAFPFLLRLGLRAARAGSPSWPSARGRPTTYWVAGWRWCFCCGARSAEDNTLVVLGGAVAPLIDWLVFYRLVLDASERALARGLVSRRGRAR